MTLEADRLRSLHEVQLEPHFCVPACVCMVLKAWQRPADQRAIAGSMCGSPRGFSLADGAHVLGLVAEDWDIDDTSSIDWLRAHLARERWLIMKTFTSVMAGVATARGGVVGRHGLLPATPGLLHAIIVVGASGMGFQYLDPWFEADAQPLHMSAPDLVRAWQAGVVVVDPRTRGAAMR